MGNESSSPASCGTNPYDYPTFDEDELPRGLKFSLKFLTDEQIRLCRRLCERGQEHFFDDWSKMAPGARRAFCEHLENVDEELPHGGLELYIDKIRRLLDAHRSERNRWEGWEASAPTGIPLKFGKEGLEVAERYGQRDLGKVAFILNASEMGTDVGYSDALVKMPVELTSYSSYLQTYIQHILAVQQRYAPTKKVPLCVLASKQTFKPIVEFLEENDRFGMDPSQIHVLVPEWGVPLVESYKARIAMDPGTPGEIYTLPEGDGCLHTLVHNSELAKQWATQGFQYVFFFEGANALALQALPYMLYVSKTDKLVLNYLTVPRKVNEPMDAMVKLSARQKNFVGMVCVDHRQLDTFLKSSQYFRGDHKDDKTGYSTFPGSTHTMLMQLECYNEVLERTGGELPGSLTPVPGSDKKKLLEPCRATSSITDISQVLTPDQSACVGITCMEASFCHAPVKVSPVATAEIRREGLPVFTASTAEMAVYNFHRRILRHIGCKVEESPEETFHDLTLSLNPNIVFHPSFCLTMSDYKERFPNPENVKISKRSTMVVRGAGVLIPNLVLDGCLLIDCDEGFSAKVNGKVWNSGWEIVPAPADPNESDPVIGMRGYQVDRRDKKLVQAGEKPSSCVIL